MSHTTEIKSVPIKDIKALRAAVKELQKNGVQCELVENQAPRMYYDNQHGPCAYVLKLKNSRYDVGFAAQYDQENKTSKKAVDYKLVLDTWGDYIAKELGYSSKETKQGEDKHLAAVGKLTQAYTKHATINAARAAGYSVRSTKRDNEGNIHLVLAGM